MCTAPAKSERDTASISEKKKEPAPMGQLLIALAYQLGDLVSGSPLSELSDLKQTSIMPAPVLIDLLAEVPSELPNHSAASSSSSSSSSTVSLTTTSVSQSVTDSVLASGSLNLLLIDDQTVPWLSPSDLRYQVGVKLCALRDHLEQPVESKASLPELQQTLQTTLIGSPIEVLLWVDEAGEDPGHAFAETAWRLWQVPHWQAYRPGDPPPAVWLPLQVNLHQPSMNSPVFTRTHQPPEGAADFTESEWQLLRNQFALFWLVQGMGQLTEPCNLFEVNELHRAQGRTRLVLHSDQSVAFTLEESTYFMPHGAEGQLLPASYAHYTTDPTCDFNTWEGRYQGKIGHAAQKTTQASIILTPAKDLALNRNQLILPDTDEKTTLGKGAFGEVLRGSYYRQPVAVKRFKEAKLSASDQAQLKDEAAVMANLQSPFLVRLLGLSLESPSLLVMELAEGGSLYDLLKDQNKEFSWIGRLRVLRDIALGLSVLHAHELLHRDLKSLNILLDADGRAKLCDFGLSTLKSQAKETRDVGTLLWNAPEVLQGKAATMASDVYSFAIICWEVVTRRLPYKDSTTGHIKKSFAEHVQGGEREIIPTDCPPELAAVIKACWAQDPCQRPTASQVAQILEELWQKAVAAEQSQPPLQWETSKDNSLNFSSMPSSISLENRQATSLTLTTTDEKLLNGFRDLSPEMLASLMPNLVKQNVALIEKKEDHLTELHKIPSSLVGTDASVVEFKTLLAESAMPCWQDYQSTRYTLGVKLQCYRQKALIDPKTQQALACYIAPNGQSQPGLTSDSLTPWVEREFLQSDAKVLLLQGSAGAGKSTFNCNLALTLWQHPAWQAFDLVIRYLSHGFPCGCHWVQHKRPMMI